MRGLYKTSISLKLIKGGPNKVGVLEKVEKLLSVGGVYLALESMVKPSNTKVCVSSKIILSWVWY